MPDIAIIVSCHEPYLKWLPTAMDSINRQVKVAEYVVVFDGCRAPVIAEGQWRVVEGNWQHPSAARNAGLAVTTSPWVIFWDADNVMAEGYLSAMSQAVQSASHDLGVIYPDIHFCDEQMTPQALWVLPAWDYWGLRAENCIDTASVWRRDAIEMAGGWSQRATSFEDYVLALDITALGWTAQKLDGPPVLMRVHEKSQMQTRVREGKVSQSLWGARSLAIVSLLAGRDETFGGWTHFLRTADLPPRSALYVLDNSGRPEFTRKAADECQRIAEDRNFTHLDFAVAGHAYQAAAQESYLIKARHQHVADLYASVLPRVTEDIVLALEDDIEAPPDAARKLCEELGWHSRGNIGAVAAVYAMPHNDSEVCSGDGHGGGWGQSFQWEQVPDEPSEVGCVGGGCTVWANWALHGYPVHLQWDQLLGWDGVLCVELRRRGYRIRLHGGVRCSHHTHGKPRGGLAGATAIVSKKRGKDLYV